jgi:hypothetical protein
MKESEPRLALQQLTCGKRVKGREEKETAEFYFRFGFFRLKIKEKLK